MKNISSNRTLMSFFQNRKSIIIPEFFSLSSSSFETSEVFSIEVASSSAGSNKLCFSEENTEDMRGKIEVQQLKNLYNFLQGIVAKNTHRKFPTYP